MLLNDFWTLEQCRIESGDVLIVSIVNNNRLLIRDEKNLPKYFSEYFPQHVNVVGAQPEEAELEVHDEDENPKKTAKEMKREPSTSISQNPSHADSDGRGPIKGIPVGKTWATRMDCHRAHVHRPPVAGIAGLAANGGAVSIVLSGGYKGDKDYGHTFTYSGSGSDEELTGGNLALAVTCAGPFSIHNVPDKAKAANWRFSKAIRVIRGSKGDKAFSPKTGYRYDGIYKVTKYWKTTHHGKVVFKYELRRDDPTPGPWELTVDNEDESGKEILSQNVAQSKIENGAKPSRKSVCARRESSSGRVLISSTKGQI